MPTPDSCPRCGSVAQVRSKLLLINAAKPCSDSKWRTGFDCEGFSVSDLRPDCASGQFMSGLYCDGCAIGYLPESLAKPAAPTFLATPQGWRRVFPDGTLGPIFERMCDDPELGD